MDNVCLTKECITSAAHLLKSMDQNVDPCEDFYSFVCGSFIDNAVMAEGQGTHSIMGEMRTKNEYSLHKALSEPYDPDIAPADEQMAKDFYTSR